MISNRLLSLVMGLDAVAKQVDGNNLLYSFDAIGERRETKINIYELSDKCKEWAFKRKTSIRTARSFKIDGYLVELFQDYNPMFDTVDLIYSRYNKSEIEGIFEACEFILDNQVPF